MSNDFASIFSKIFLNYSTKIRGMMRFHPTDCTKSEKWGLGTGDTAFVGLDVHQDDVGTNAADAVPGDAEVLFSAKEAQNAAGPRDDDGADTSVGDLHLHVGNESQPTAVIDADDFLAL